MGAFVCYRWYLSAGIRQTTLRINVPFTPQICHVLKSLSLLQVPVNNGERNGNPLQFSCLENPTDRGAWWATVHKVAESGTTEATKRAREYRFHPESRSILRRSRGDPTLYVCSASCSLLSPIQRSAMWVNESADRRTEAQGEVVQQGWRSLLKRKTLVTVSSAASQGYGSIRK